jgi:hypothetical protein
MNSDGVKFCKASKKLADACGGYDPLDWKVQERIARLGKEVRQFEVNHQEIMELMAIAIATLRRDFVSGGLDRVFRKHCGGCARCE